MTPIERPPSLTETVLLRLRSDIVRGVLGLGELLSERVLAEQLGVSKTPVREALAQLRTEGLVRIVPQRGALVFTLSSAEVTALCEFRATLEQSALKLAIHRASDSLAEDLRRIVTDMDIARDRNDRTAYLNADTAFHEAFFSHCGNSYLIDTYALHIGKIAALRTHLATKPFHTEKSYAEHRQMADAVSAGKIDATLAILDTHIGRTRQTYANGIEDIAEADRRMEQLASRTKSSAGAMTGQATEEARRA